MADRSTAAISGGFDGAPEAAIHAAPGSHALVEATLMTALAGFVDAVGYTAMGHLYLSFMSGNSTLLGMAVARVDGHVIGWAGAVIASFVIGAFFGSLVSAAQARARLPLVLACELGCLLAAWALDGILATNFALLLVAIAMGMQNAIQKSIAGTSSGKSFITGALFGVGDALARACLGRARFAEAGVNAISWLAFIVGVTGGALVVGAWGVAPSLLVASAIVLVLMALAIRAMSTELTLPP